MAETLQEALNSDTACGVCQDEAREGKRLPEEVNEGTVGECEFCWSPVCESHGRQFNSRSFSGIAHEQCWEV